MAQEAPEEPVPERLDPTVVGVMGAGVIGTGVAHSLALAGHRVTLVDIDRDALDRTRDHIDRDLRVSAMIGNQAPDPAQVTARITATTDVHALRDAAFVVENVTESWEIKRRVYPALDAVCPPACIYIANTSAIPITRIASVTNRPDRVVGAHFMNPVPRTKAVELIPGHHTSPHSLARVRALLASLDKTVIEVGDSCGFVSNRVLMLTVNEAAYLVHENVADAATVDRIFRDCFGHAMGPLETADLIGLDTVLRTVEVLHTYFADSKYRPCPLLRHMVDAGLLGRKSGAGFHDYGASQAATHRSASDRA
ncbi:MAG: 3-hydroxyacyl-CoA dehydrogenase family protein [Pseudonocardiaceae bacterium]